MTNRIRSALVATALLLAAACAGTQTVDTAQAMMNTKCPMSGETLEAGSPTADFKGGKVGFCCENCMSKWNHLSDADKETKLTAAK